MTSRRWSHAALAAVVIGGTVTLAGAFALGRRSAGPALGAASSAAVTKPAAPVPPEVRDRFAGNWSVHGESLEINADLTAVAVWNAGPCGAGMCAGRETLHLAPRDDVLVGTIVAVTIEDESGRPVPPGSVEDDGTRRPGSAVTLSLIDKGVLERTYAPGGAGNPYLCAADASAEWKLKCNV